MDPRPQTPARILIVEDDPGNALVMKKILVKLGGMSVGVTEDGDAVLEAVSGGTVDAVVMDVSLANTWLDGVRVDGVELTRRLKAAERQGMPPVPVLLATAHAMLGDRERLLGESGADAYLAKPILDPHLLVEAVRHLLGDVW